MMTGTERLSELIAVKPITQADLNAAALFALDAIASMLAGRHTDQGRIVYRWGAGLGAVETDRVGDAGRRALVLGALCHILEIDDLHRASVVHPGCVVVPAVWGVAEARTTPVAGHEALTAVLWGFEATTRLGMAVGGVHYRIWHNTATCGPFGSAMAAARLLALTPEQTVHALGNAGTQAAGLWQFLDSGAMSKHLHAGRGAEAGVVAAELAALGFTGAADILEGSRGFFAGMCPDGDVGLVTADPEAEWQVHHTSIKPWPSCRHTHPAIDAALEIAGRLQAAGKSTGEIEAVAVEAYEAALNLCDRPRPASVYDAKFSLQHTVAAALTGGKVDFEDFEQAARERLAPLRGRTKVKAAARFEDPYPADWGSAVRIRLADGEEIAAERTAAKGDPSYRLDRVEMIDKARGLLQLAGQTDAEGLIETVLAMAEDGPLPRLPI